MNKSVYQRPSGKRFLTVKNRTAPERALIPPPASPFIEVHRGTECHVTPLGPAQTMAELIAWQPGEEVLEPQAGTGNLVAAMIDQGVAPECISAMELNGDLFSFARQRLPNIREWQQGDFLEYAASTARRFDVVITNPPFRPHRQHMQAAVNLLKPGGRVVALVPVTFQGDRFVEVQRLPPDTFSTAAVYTKIVKLEQ